MTANDRIGWGGYGSVEEGLVLLYHEPTPGERVALGSAFHVRGTAGSRLLTAKHNLLWAGLRSGETAPPGEGLSHGNWTINPLTAVFWGLLLRPQVRITEVESASVYDDEDLALLKVDAPPQARPLRLLERQEYRDRVELHGFPVEEGKAWPTGPKVVRGYVDRVGRHGSYVLPDLDSSLVEWGFSGGPVWSREFDGVVGMTLARWSSGSPVTLRQAEISTVDRIFKVFPGLREELRPANPFPGLDAFDAAHRTVFLGRDRESDEVAQLILRPGDGSSQGVAVFGPSGRGKSSLVLAGVVPRLGESRATPTVATCRLSQVNGAGVLAGALLDAASSRSRRWTNEELVKVLDDPGRSGEVLADVVGTGPDSWLLLVLDGAEALLTRPRQERLRFCKQVSHLVNSPYPWGAGRVRLMMTARTEVREQLLAELGREGVSLLPYELREMPVDELESLVHGAVAAAAPGVRVDPELSARLRRDVEEFTGEWLPSLALVLHGLWEQEEGGRLTTRSYAQLGELHGAMANIVKGVCQASGNDDACRELLIQLVAPIAGVGGTARWTRVAVPVEDLTRTARSVLDRFVDRRLIQSYPSGRDGEAELLVELVHDSLIATLEKITNAAGMPENWLTEEAGDFRAWQFRVQQARSSGRRLTLRELLESRAHLKGDFQRWIGERDREWLSRSWRRFATKCTAGIAAASFAVALFIWSLDALLDSGAAKAAEVTAKQAVQEKSEDRSLALAMAAAAQARSPLPEAESVLAERIATVAGGGDPRLVVPGGGEIVSLAVDDSGRHAVAMTADGGATVWEGTAGTTPRLVGRHPQARSAALSRDGTTLAFGDDLGAVLVSGLDGRVRARLDPPPEVGNARAKVAGVRFSPDGTMLAVRWEDGEQALLWRWTEHGGNAQVVLRQIDRRMPFPNPLWSLDFTPDGKWVVGGAGMNMATVWQLDGKARELPEYYHSDTLVPGEDGVRLYGCLEGRIQVFDIAWPKPLPIRDLPAISSCVDDDPGTLNPRTVGTRQGGLGVATQDGSGYRLNSASRDHQLPATSDRGWIALGAQWRQAWSSSGNVLRLTALGSVPALDTQRWDGEVRVLVTPGDGHVLTWDDHHVASWRASDGRQTAALAADGAPAAFGSAAPETAAMAPWALSPSGRRLALSLPGRRVVWVVDAVTLRQISEIAPRRVSPPGAPGMVQGLGFVSEGELAVWGEGVTERWNLAEGRPGPLLRLDSAVARPLNAVAVRPGTGEVALARSADNQIRLLDPDTGRVRKEFRLPGNDVAASLGFSPTGDLLTVSDRRGGVAVFDMSSTTASEPDQVIPGGGTTERRVFGLLGEGGWFLSDGGSLEMRLDGDSLPVFRQAPRGLLWARPLPGVGRLLLARRPNNLRSTPAGLMLIPLDVQQRRAHACRITGQLHGWEGLLPDNVDRDETCVPESAAAGGRAPVSGIPWTIAPNAQPLADGEPTSSATPFSLSDAVKEMRSRHVEPEDGSTAPPGPLRAFVGVCVSVNGQCRRLVFFHHGTLVLDREVHLIKIVSQDGTTVKISYPTFRPTDAPCCPSGERVVVTYHWDGAAVVPDRKEP
ncbi:LppP/LprE family lipoprotein [Nonomuraea sp. NPDC001636]|uniref:nSTAND1 domain-containing NTPase n=1 Tax=Nonomuraea sp. NPDC001636 TaxID=3154391 RepID=UPI00333007C8